MGEQPGLGDATEPPRPLYHLEGVIDGRRLDEGPRPLALSDGGEGGRELEVGAKGLDEVLALGLASGDGLREDLGYGLERLTGSKELFVLEEDEPDHAVCEGGFYDASLEAVVVSLVVRKSWLVDILVGEADPKEGFSNSGADGREVVDVEEHGELV